MFRFALAPIAAFCLGMSLLAPLAGATNVPPTPPTVQPPPQAVAIVNSYRARAGALHSQWIAQLNAIVANAVATLNTLYRGDRAIGPTTNGALGQVDRLFGTYQRNLAHAGSDAAAQLRTVHAQEVLAHHVLSAWIKYYEDLRIYEHNRARQQIIDASHAAQRRR